MTELSVVLISKNQEWNIARLVESVLAETDHLPGTEIVLVDSASTDLTTEIAARYPISVLKLSPDQRLSAAAGRSVGYKQTKGELVLFLDGDMELCKGWLDQALRVMESRSDVAVVCGKVIDLAKTTRSQGEKISSFPPEATSMDYVPHGGGAALYRRSVLEKVGNFNPYLYSDEEPELCLRIRYAGYRILRLSHPTALHYSDSAEAFSTLLGRRNRNLWLGYGQNLRYYYGSSLFWPYIRERGWAIAPVVMIIIGIIAVIATGLTGDWVWLTLVAALMALLIIGVVVQKRSIKHGLFSIFQRLLIVEGTIRGMLMKPYDPAGYPGKYKIIQ